jgi:hypothetical protein
MGLTGLGIPQPHRLVITATNETLAIGAKGHRTRPKTYALAGVDQGVDRFGHPTAAPSGLHYH